MNEQAFSDICTYTRGREDFIPPWTEKKASCCGHQMRQHLIVSTGSTGAMLHGPLCMGHCTILHP